MEELFKVLIVEDDEDKKIFIEFEEKINNPINVSLIEQLDFGNFNTLNDMSEYFRKIENILIVSGYCGDDNLIKKINDIIKEKIANFNIINFNRMLIKFNIKPLWNHFDILFNIPDLIDWWNLARNPAAITLLKENQGKTYFCKLSSNPAAVDLIKAKPDEIDWDELSKNTSPYAIKLLEENTEKIYWWGLLHNPAAVELIKSNPDKIIWHALSSNTSPEIIKMLEENPDLITCDLSRNNSPEAVELLKKYPAKIDWVLLSENMYAIDLLEANIDRINWPRLSSNKYATNLIKNNMEKISWYNLSANSGMVEFLEKNPTKVCISRLSLNDYDYKKEKISAINGLKLFPITKFIIR